MTPTVSRLLRWAAVIGLGIALTLAAWQDPVLAHAPGRAGTAVPGFAVASIAPAALGLLLAARRRPPRLSRRPAPARPLSAPRSPGTRRSRR
ncbi:hypothetical protein O7600_29890 [Micromonospora sp. WMMA1998]|uniref:hypothetical protein n=1 Tax=Micromonospora sp. WMMA1998 TaxID=3015167 RepID=UPI00248D0A78|nr:hypothetical protein [Micromonospora sp. WMMA1998]WBC15224.1 hypothetical protein O7600_29890 [Micromonospora sp. WMMA1998]